MEANLTFRDSREGDEVVIRTIGLGMQPLVLIEPREDENGEVTLDIDVTDLDSEELSDLLAIIAHSLRVAEEDDDDDV